MPKSSVPVLVAIEDIRENPVALRAVDRESEAFAGLRDSIALTGLLNAISLRKKTEIIDGVEVTYYELIDGLHRYCACRDADLKEIPAILKDLSDTEVEEAQVMANAHRIETHPVEYTRALNRILAGNPTMTAAELAGRLSKSSTWVSQRLGLLKLSKEIAALVDDGKIKLSNAIALCKLPQEDQVNYVDSAMTMGADEFVPTIQARQKVLRDAARAGRAAKPAEFVPIMRLQKMSDLKSELESPVIGPNLVKAEKAKTAAAGFQLGIAWALNIDKASVDAQRAKAEAKASSLADARKRREADRTAKKAEDAEKKAADAKAALTV